MVSMYAQGITKQKTPFSAELSHTVIPQIWENIIIPTKKITGLVGANATIISQIKVLLFILYENIIKIC